MSRYTVQCTCIWPTQSAYKTRQTRQVLVSNPEDVPWLLLLRGTRLILAPKEEVEEEEEEEEPHYIELTVKMASQP